VFLLVNCEITQVSGAHNAILTHVVKPTDAFTQYKCIYTFSHSRFCFTRSSPHCRVKRRTTLNRETRFTNEVCTIICNVFVMWTHLFATYNDLKERRIIIFMFDLSQRRRFRCWQKTLQMQFNACTDARNRCVDEFKRRRVVSGTRWIDIDE
jgi:hypothetical protein